MVLKKWQLSGAASVVALLAAGSAQAQTVSAEQIDKLQNQIQTLQRELQAMKKKVDAAPEKAYAAPAPVLKAPPGPPPSAVAQMSAGNRPSICTPDLQNCIAFTSRLHLDYGGYSYSPNTSSTNPQHLDSGINARRARIGVLGTFAGDWQYALIYDFGGSADGFAGSVGSNNGTTTTLLPGGGTSGIQTALVGYAGIRPLGGQLVIEAGYQDVPWTLDEATSSNDIMFIERASSVNIATNIAAGDFRSSAGFRWFDKNLWVSAYATGPVSGSIHTGNVQTEQFGAVARVAWQIYQDKDYSFHIGGNYENLFKPVTARTNLAGVAVAPNAFQSLTLSDRPELRIDPTVIVTTTIPLVSNAQVLGVEGAAQLGPLFVQGEYFHYDINRKNGTGLPDLHFDGGYAEAGWVITGEKRPYNQAAGAYGGIVPANPFSSKGGWGAIELAGRWSVVDLNDKLGVNNLPIPGLGSTQFGANGGRQTIYTAGLNWYATRNVMFKLNYLHGDINKLSSTVATPAPTNAGAKFDAVALRTQVAF